MGTLACPQADPVQFMKTSVVKIVSDTLGHALYFSRRSALRLTEGGDDIFK
jgi:CMP-2-keto-3-deoxyoctulosonic acid synthetase